MTWDSIVILICLGLLFCGLVFAALRPLRPDEMADVFGDWPRDPRGDA